MGHFTFLMNLQSNFLHHNKQTKEKKSITLPESNIIQFHIISMPLQ